LDLMKVGPPNTCSKYMRKEGQLFGRGTGKGQKPTLISCSTGVCRPGWSAMIEFQLKIDSKITREIVPLIITCFSEAGRVNAVRFPCPEETDEVLIESWNTSLEEDLLHDRHKVAGLFNDPKFAHGYVEIADEDAEAVLRSLTELRLFIRETRLREFIDHELENGDFTLSQKSKDNQFNYLAYVILAEVQEGLIKCLV